MKEHLQCRNLAWILRRDASEVACWSSKVVASGFIGYELLGTVITNVRRIFDERVPPCSLTPVIVPELAYDQWIFQLAHAIAITNVHTLARNKYNSAGTVVDAGEVEALYDPLTSVS